MRARETSPGALLHAEPELRYFVADGLIGVPLRRLYARTLRRMALWLGVPPLVAACLASVNARRAMHGVDHWWARRVVRHLGGRLQTDGMSLTASGWGSALRYNTRWKLLHHDLVPAPRRMLYNQRHTLIVGGRRAGVGPAKHTGRVPWKSRIVACRASIFSR